MEVNETEYWVDILLTSEHGADGPSWLVKLEISKFVCENNTRLLNTNSLVSFPTNHPSQPLPLEVHPNHAMASLLVTLLCVLADPPSRFNGSSSESSGSSGFNDGAESNEGAYLVQLGPAAGIAEGTGLGDDSVVGNNEGKFVQDQEKTLIYKLVKKLEKADDVNIPTPTPTVPSEFKVYFSNYYKTQKQVRATVDNGEFTGKKVLLDLERASTQHGSVPLRDSTNFGIGVGYGSRINITMYSRSSPSPSTIPEDTISGPFPYQRTYLVLCPTHTYYEEAAEAYRGRYREIVADRTKPSKSEIILPFTKHRISKTEPSFISSFKYWGGVRRILHFFFRWSAIHVLNVIGYTSLHRRGRTAERALLGVDRVATYHRK
uniref:Uncharacterized protein n=1 Tax=Timema monikensis TaxID=170555 RepID=A0A7R9EF20_9NEOP|nr:unnamed protein product [Timema monikensis]